MSRAYFSNPRRFNVAVTCYIFVGHNWESPLAAHHQQGNAFFNASCFLR